MLTRIQARCRPVEIMILIEWVLAILLALVVAQYFKRKHQNDLIRNLNGPFTIPLIGGVQFLFGITPENFLQLAIGARQKWGKLFRIWVLNRLIFAVFDPTVAEVVLSSQVHITKLYLYNLLKPWLGTGLLMSDGHKWHSRRKIITPSFHFKILEQFVEVFDQQSEILVKQMERHCDTGKEFDVFPFICLSTLDIITETAMGTKINAQTDSENDYTRAVTDISQIIFIRFLKTHLINEVAFAVLCPRLKRRQMDCIKTMHNFTRNVIETRRSALQETLLQEQPKIPSPSDNIESKNRSALLDVLLQSTIDGKPLSNEDIREEVDTFMFEGHDTTTSAICFTLSLIARHPEVQQKVFQEICEILGRDQTQSISYRVLQDLKYTECVIKESLRIFPPVPFIGRQLENDLAYEGGVLPAGGEIIVGIWVMCMDPDLFPEPTVFRPERHLLDASKRVIPFSFLPFSAGPRNCIGQKFAMLEIKCVITKILRYYELLPLGEDVKPSINLVLKSNNGFQIGLKKRNYFPNTVQ